MLEWRNQSCPGVDDYLDQQFPALFSRIACLALGALGYVHLAAEGDGGHDEEQGEEAHARLADELPGKAAGAAAHELSGLLGAPEKDLCSNNQHENPCEKFGLRRARYHRVGDVPLLLQLRLRSRTEIF